MNIDLLNLYTESSIFLQMHQAVKLFSKFSRRNEAQLNEKHLT